MALLEPDWSLGDYIAKARRTAGLDQADIAATCGVSRALVSRWERDQSEPTARQLLRIVELTGAQYLTDPQNWKLMNTIDLRVLHNPVPRLPIDWTTVDPERISPELTIAPSPKVAECESFDAVSV